MARTIGKYINNPGLLFISLGHRGWWHWMSDERYLKVAYRLKMGRRLHLDPPVTFNEKIQWLKIHDRKPIYTTLVDKYLVKKWVADRIGEEYVIPTLGVWEHFNDIDFNTLPDQFVLKCTHNSGGVVICRNKAELNLKSAKKTIERDLSRNFYWGQREWPYKNVVPRIIAEQYLEDKETDSLIDYKFFAFDGDVKALFVATDRNSKKETKFDFYDANFHHLPIINGHPNARVEPAKPETFDRMKELAAILSKGIPQVRCDFYEVDGKVYFGEMTFSHYSGFVPFEPSEYDVIFGEWIHLPN